MTAPERKMRERSSDMRSILVHTLVTVALAGCAAQTPQARAESSRPPESAMEPEASQPSPEAAPVTPETASEASTPAPEAGQRPPDTPALVPNDDPGAVASGPGAAAAAPPPATSAEVLRAVDGLQGLSSWTVIPFAHFRRGDRHVVVAWPAINSAGRLVDATVVGICLEQATPGVLQERGRRWVVREPQAARAAMIEALGGEDYEVLDRDDGLALDQLGPQLSRHGSEFVEAMDAGDRAGARRAATAFARMLPLERVSLENGAAQLLWAAATHHGRLELVDTVRQGDTATLTFEVLRGRQRFRTIQARARRVVPGRDVWVLESYQ
jgi:hypothetical protein